jgi:hypothetical protein
MYLKKFISATLITSTAFLGLASLAFGISPISVQAAGITTTVTPSSQVVSSSANIVLSFTPATPITNGSTITIITPTGYTGFSTLVDADVAVTGTNITSSTETFANPNITSTLTTSANVTTPVTITISNAKLTTASTAGNYSFGIITSVGDFGAVLQYVGQANVVNVTGIVAPTLSFVIRNATDTANTNVCNLGTLTTTAVNDCQYRLKIGTNAQNGYVVQSVTTGNFTNGSNIITNAAPGAAGTNITAGNEFYGVRIAPGVVSTGSISVPTAFDAGATNFVNYSHNTNQTVLTSTGRNNPGASGDTTNTSLFTHRGAINSVTAAGLYTQTITYTVTPSF